MGWQERPLRGHQHDWIRLLVMEERVLGKGEDGVRKLVICTINLPSCRIPISLKVPAPAQPSRPWYSMYSSTLRTKLMAWAVC
jgi:hypothetical protein